MRCPLLFALLSLALTGCRTDLNFDKRCDPTGGLDPTCSAAPDTDGASADSAVADVGPDFASADAAIADAAIADAAVTDAAVTDAAITDAAVTDAAITDAAINDAAVSDAAPLDGAPHDAQARDATFPPDAQVDMAPDSALPDAATPDAGPDALPLDAAVEVEVCNGRDDDQDGTTDEGTAVPCPQLDGVCGDWAQSCVGGELQACSGDNAGPDDNCDDLDNDCDGDTDEGGQSCCQTPGSERICGVGTSAGECFKGIKICGVDHVWRPCVDVVGPAPEACNGLDDDCDTLVDEDAPMGDGLDECDNKDNDCDGRIDEDGDACCVPDDRTRCGIQRGECEEGQRQCGADGRMGACMGGVGRVPEVCDDDDNDCDGETDEGNPGGGDACETGLGDSCEAGSLTCERGRVRCLPVDVTHEICDGEDNDCDGETDEGHDLELCEYQPEMRCVDGACLQ